MTRSTSTSFRRRRRRRGAGRERRRVWGGKVEEGGGGWAIPEREKERETKHADVGYRARRSLTRFLRGQSAVVLGRRSSSGGGGYFVAAHETHDEDN